MIRVFLEIAYGAVWMFLALCAGGFVAGFLLALIESVAVVRAVRRRGER